MECKKKITPYCLKEKRFREKILREDDDMA